MDLIKTIVAVLSLYPDSTKRELLKNIVMVGGPSKLSGLKERMERDLRR
jgi:actin-related protein